MQLHRSSWPVILSVLILLLNFSISTNASPLSLRPRDDTCPTGYILCTETSACCPSGTTCNSVGGCDQESSDVVSSSATSSPTSTATTTASSTPSASTSSAAKSSGKNEPFFSTNMIIAVATGGGIALLLIIIGIWACHRKRQQGRALLAAYESPDRTPYEAISLKTKKSTASFNSTAPPAPVVPGTPKPSTPTSTTFNVPQHTATPPPDYKNGTSAQVAVDEKELFPRYPPQAFQGQDSPRTPTGSQRGPFPAEVLGSPRGSSLPPYSPVRSGFANQQGPVSSQQVSSQQAPPSPAQATFPQQQAPPSPAQATFPQQQAALSPTQANFSRQQPILSPIQANFSQQQATLSPTQASFSQQQTAFSSTQASSPQHPTGFSFTPQGGATPVPSRPASPMIPSVASQELFLPVDNYHPANQELFLPVDNQQPADQELFSPVDDHQPPQGPQPEHGYPMAY